MVVIAASASNISFELASVLAAVSDPSFSVELGATQAADAEIIGADHSDAIAASDRRVIAIGAADELATIEDLPQVFDVIDWPSTAGDLRRSLSMIARRLQKELDRTNALDKRKEIDTASLRIASADLDLDGLMDLVCVELLALTPSDGTVVEMLDGQEIVYRAAAGTIASRVGFRMPAAGSLSGRVLDSGELLVSDDTETDARVNREATRALSIRSMAIAPLRSKSGVVGVLKMASGQPHAFSTSDLEAIRAMGDLIGAALQREIDRTELRALAHTDPLTGLLNRRGFDERASRSIKRAFLDNRTSAVLQIDIDHFKAVNDTYGHPGGDAVLRSVAQTVGRVTRPADVIGRMGGEEVAIVLPGMTRQAAFETAERIRAEIASTVVPFDGEWIRITASIGVAMVNRDYLDEALAAADEALYRAKTGGRNRVEGIAPVGGNVTAINERGLRGVWSA